MTTRPFRLLHRLRSEDVMRYSSRITLALAMIEAADPEPVPNAALTEAFACAPPETSNTMARMRSLGLVERIGGASASYRLSDEGRAMQARLAAMFNGADENHA